MIANPGAKSLDALVYAVAVTVAATLACSVVVLATDSGLVGLKVALFLVGFLLFAYGTIRLWLALSPADADDTMRPIPRDRTPFESGLARVAPPLDDLVPMEHRFSPHLKLFIASLLVLGLSLALEVVFGVGVE